MTYNIRLDTRADGADSWVHRRHMVSAQIEWLRPDIFGLQEVLINQKRELATDLPNHRIVGNGRDDGKEGGESSPIGYDIRRLTSDESGTFWLSPTPGSPSKGWDAAYPRVVTWVRLHFTRGSGHLLVLNTHWDHVGIEARRQSAIQIRVWLANHRRKQESVVMLGDFNTAIDNEEMRPLLAADGAVALRDSRRITQTSLSGNSKNHQLSAT